MIEYGCLCEHDKQDRLVKHYPYTHKDVVELVNGARDSVEYVRECANCVDKESSGECYCKELKAGETRLLYALKPFAGVE